MTMRSRRALFALAALALFAGACGDDDEDADASAATEAPAATEPAPEPTVGEEPSTTTGDADAGTGVPIELATTDLGEILTSDGRTLYVFTPDNGGASTCYDQCAQAWPPLLAEGDVAPADGVDASLFGTTPRDDGGEQVTVDGWPLYFFASDSTPGDTNGQGVGNNWWVVGADGQAITG